MKPGIKTTEAAGTAIGTLGPIAAVAFDKIPPGQVWIALVVAGVVAVTYISWRSWLKLKGINGQAPA